MLKKGTGKIKPVRDGLDKRWRGFYNHLMRKRIILLISIITIFSAVYGNVSTQPYGINVHLESDDVLAKVVSAGIKWIRAEITWAAIEPVQGQFYWADVDRVVNYAAANGLSPLMIIAYTPNWANGNKGRQYPPNNINHWENFVRTAINRYKDRVKYWSIWNEPNSPEFFAEGKDVFVSQIFLPAAMVIKNTDPGAFIVGPELAHVTGTGSEWYFWMKYILNLGGNYIDIISHHIYKNEGVTHIYELLEMGETLIPPVTDILEETGQQDKPFWITETGWNTADMAESEQSELYLDMLRQRRTKGFPHKIFFYEIQDDPAAGIKPWGILRADNNDKPAYAVYRDFIDGKYPEDGGGDDNGSDNKKLCSSEKVAYNSFQRVRAEQVLSSLRLFRDDFSQYSPAASALVKVYYAKSDEVSRLLLGDSRLFRLSGEIIGDFARFFSQNRETLKTQRLEKPLLDRCRRMIRLLRKKPLSTSLRAALDWGERQIFHLESMPIRAYVTSRLSRQFRGVKTLKGMLKPLIPSRLLNIF